MQRNSILYDQYAAQSSYSMGKSEPISPLHASVDPRFSNIVTRAVSYQERVKQQQVSPTSLVHSPSVITINSNAWSPVETPKEKSVITEKKSFLSPASKTRLQGLLVGLAIAAISTGVTLAVLLTRPSTSNSATTTVTTAPACSSLQWSESGVSVAGNGTYGSASNQLSNPWGIYVDSNYAIYVADSSNHRVQQWLPNAVTATTAAGVTGVSGSNNSLLSYPRAVYADSQQNLYVGDNYGISIWLSGASVGSRIASSGGFGSVYGISVDKNGNIYASFSGGCSVQMWTSVTATSILVAGGTSCGYASSQLDGVYGFTVNSETNMIYIANAYVQTIVAWSVGATNGTIVAGRNSTYGSADFLLYYPYDVKQDSYGNLYVADSDNNRVVLLCQNPPSTSARIIAGYQLSYPRSIALDSDSNLYLSANNRVLKFTRIS